ncbi:MAG: hypothetical protein ACREBQ_00265 [Nitrososphaerales archaeon]
MFCSKCGQKLGSVAHIVNNELLCEDCFLNLGQAQNGDQQHTVFLSHINEDERVAASQAIPNGNVPQVTLPANQATQKSMPSGQVPQSSSISSPLMLSGEQVLWKRTFSKGIIHKEATLTEMITNLRVLCIDDLQQVIVRAAPLGSATIAVTNTRRDYSGVHTGFERYGAYTGVSRGSGVTIGNVQVFVQGRIVLTLSNIRDPFGLKRLIDNSVKSSRHDMR